MQMVFAEIENDIEQIFSRNGWSEKRFTMQRIEIYAYI